MFVSRVEGGDAAVISSTQSPQCPPPSPTNAMQFRVLARSDPTNQSASLAHTPFSHPQ